MKLCLDFILCVSRLGIEFFEESVGSSSVFKVDLSYLEVFGEFRAQVNLNGHVWFYGKGSPVTAIQKVLCDSFQTDSALSRVNMQGFPCFNDIVSIWKEQSMQLQCSVIELFVSDCR